MRQRRRYFANLANVGREGRRFYAFYKGYRAFKTGGGAICPYPPGGEDYDCWRRGWRYAAQESSQ